MKKPKSEKLSKVAQGNEIGAWLSSVGPFLKGACRICGCPPNEMPMVFRGTDWCSENHRKELEKQQRAQQEKA